MTAIVLAAATLTTTPLLSSSDDLDRGATAVYTLTIVQGTDYWIVLDCPAPPADFDVCVASREMDFDSFMNMPYYDDFLYAGGFALASGSAEGGESFSLTAPYTGPAYVVIHDIGETGGEYELKVY
jgi:hypothetical protein